MLTKDLEVFVDGSWAFPYLVMVPVNTLISGGLLYNMFGPTILVCFGGMVLLVLLQIWSNKALAKLQSNWLSFSDERIEYISHVM